MQEHDMWLRIAEEDLRSAIILFKSDAFNNAAYYMQQSSEKSLKAYLVSKKHKIEKTHDLVYLLKICFDYDPEFWKLFGAAKELNPFSVRSRYPDNYISLEENEASILIKNAEEILSFVKSKIK